MWQSVVQFKFGALKGIDKDTRDEKPETGPSSGQRELGGGHVANSQRCLVPARAVVRGYEATHLPFSRQFSLGSCFGWGRRPVLAKKGLALCWEMCTCSTTLFFIILGSFCKMGATPHEKPSLSPWLFRLEALGQRLLILRGVLLWLGPLFAAGKRRSHHLVANYQRCFALARGVLGLGSASLFGKRGPGGRNLCECSKRLLLIVLGRF